MANVLDKYGRSVSAAPIALGSDGEPMQQASSNIFRTPRPPDPYAVAGAQTQINRETAAYNNAQSHGNTTTPLGSQTYTSRIDPVTGATVYDSNVSLTPDQQQLLTLQNQQDLSLGNTASGLLGNINSTYSTPMDFSGLPDLYGANDLLGARNQTQDALYNKQTSYLDPQFDARAKALESQLANQGIGLGSEAWRNAMDDFSRDRAFNYDQARTSSIAGGLGEMTGLSNIASKNRAQALSEALTRRNQPLNEFNALRDTTKINMPSFDAASGGASANTNPANISAGIYDSYNANAANAAANQQALMGLIGTGVEAAGGLGGVWNGITGLFGGGGAAATGGATGAAGAALGGGSAAAGGLGAGTATGALGSGALGSSAAGALPTSGLMTGIGSGGTAAGGATGGAATGSGLLGGSGGSVAAGGGAASGAGAASTGGAAGMNLATLGPIGAAIAAGLILRNQPTGGNINASGRTDPYAGLFTDTGYGTYSGPDYNDPATQQTLAGIDPNSGMRWEHDNRVTTYFNPDGSKAYEVHYPIDGSEPFIVQA